MNRYCKSSKLSERKFREIIKCFAADLTAVQIAHLTGVNRNTVNLYLQRIRERIWVHCEEQRPLFGVVEVDESLFGARRVKGKRGRGAYGKTTVFGLYERNGQVYTEIVPDCSKHTLQSIIRGKVTLESVINSDGWKGYSIGYGHFRDHSKDEFARGHTHVNGKGFWGAGPGAKFRGMDVHSSQTEFRYNNRNHDIGRPY